MFTVGLGVVLFGLAVGCCTVYGILLQQSRSSRLAYPIALFGIIAGAAVLALFRDGTLFVWYAVGLAFSFFASLFAYFAFRPRPSKETIQWRKSDPVSSSED